MGLPVASAPKPYRLNNGVEIKNRFTVAPLTIYDSGPNDEIRARH
jgi:2,4-dienoyl-CoA reductase-like NADH-dependent reductase (Old Yellow Enzyme family)